jgi:hypothetical protein
MVSEILLATSLIASWAFSTWPLPEPDGDAEGVGGEGAPEPDGAAGGLVVDGAGVPEPDGIGVGVGLGAGVVDRAGVLSRSRMRFGSELIVSP